MEILLASALLVSLYIVNGSLIQHSHTAIHPFLGVLWPDENVILYGVGNPRRFFYVLETGSLQSR